MRKMKVKISDFYPIYCYIDQAGKVHTIRPRLQIIVSHAVQDLNEQL